MRPRERSRPGLARGSALGVCLLLSGCMLLGELSEYRLAPDLAAPPDGGDASDAGDAAARPDASPEQSIRSCASVKPTCGPQGDTNCCTSRVVSGGSFLRSYDGVDGAEFAQP